MRSFICEALFTFAMVVLSVVVAMVLICAVGNELSRYSCNQYETITKKETRYSNFDSCYVKTVNGFERWDEYTARATANNLKEK